MKQNFQELLRSLSSTDNGGDPNAKLKSFMSFLSGVNNADAQEQQMQQQGDDVAMGGSGADKIAQNAPAQAPSFNDILNAAEGGKGNIDYDAFKKNYPTPRESAAPVGNADMWNYLISTPSRGAGLGAMAGRAGVYQDQQKLARENAKNTALDARDLAAYQAAMGLAKESGTRQDEVGKLERETARDANTAEYQRAMLRNQAAVLAQGKFQPVQLKDGSYGYIDVKHPENGVVSMPEIGNPFKPTSGGRAPKTSIPVGLQPQIDKALNRITGALDIKGKPVSGVSPLNPELSAKASSEIAQMILSGEANGADDGVTKWFAKNGGVGSLQEQTKPGMLWGTNKAGFRGFNNTAPNIGGSAVGGMKSNNDPFGFRD